MHFEFSVTLGQLVILGALLGAIWKVNRLFTVFFVEHEILVGDYIQRRSIEDPEFKMPTRQGILKKWRGNA